MKSHFIENTNKQYSIREDGIFIRYYIKRWCPKSNKYIIIYSIDIIKPSTTNVVKYILNGKSKQNTINTLLKEYFGYYFCKKCNIKVINNKSRYSKCIKCVNKRRERYHKKYPDRIKQQDLNNVINLTKSYIASDLRVSVKILTTETITAKREQLLLHRQLKTIKNENRIKSNHNNTIGYDKRS